MFDTRGQRSAGIFVERKFTRDFQKKKKKKKKKKEKSRTRVSTELAQSSEKSRTANARPPNLDSVGAP